ncbi:Heterokaryon incompatibility protein 6 [Lasiodiplodia theobromae]|uniref:Heterokaryon incompatibility protein 6 n=1 Tax=Lasiodiplodia theobromae TaxID=45133 RepID=A0A5N5D3I2_9PEZI|nr:Heterokaryon incompatibility protein 6 [Lasiodiplodia theobromae]
MENALEPRHHVSRKKIKTQQYQDDLETYQHLPLGDSEIRLLDVEPAADESDIVKATLRTVSFAEDVTPRYNAVSYCWGHRHRTEKILLRCASGDWKDFRVSHNLHSLLQHLRLPDRSTTLWIDAICIDQKNDKEKETQIVKMAQIYRKAEEVCIWLGKYIGGGSIPGRREFEISKATIEFIGEVSKQGKEMVMQNHSSGWREFILLMRVPWFSRRWVLQELAFARNPMIYCGKEKLPWETFKSAVKVFTNHFDAVLEITWPAKEWWDEQLPGYHPDRSEVEWANSVEVIRLVAFMENAFEKNTQFPVFTLEALVASMAVFETSDPRDVIYALLSVAKDRLVEPDYTANVFQIYAKFVEKVISTSGSLDIICRRWAANDCGWDFEEVLVLSPDDAIKQEPVKLSSWMRQTDGSVFNYSKYRFKAPTLHVPTERWTFAWVG